MRYNPNERVTRSVLVNSKPNKYQFKSSTPTKPITIHKKSLEIKDKQIQQSPITKQYKDTHEMIANKIFSELSAIKTEIDIPSSSFQTSPSPSMLVSKGKSKYADIYSKAQSFTNKKKCDYLFRELVNRMKEMEALEISTKKLRNENNYLKNLATAYHRTQPSKHTNEELKQEVNKLKAVVAQQQLILERFKKEVMEQYCSKKTM